MKEVITFTRKPLLDRDLLSRSVVGKDFLEKGINNANIDVWLDYRLAISKLKNEDKSLKTPINFYENEIAAIDHIITFITDITKIIKYVKNGIN